MNPEALRNSVFLDQPDALVENFLGGVPDRWGRMTPLSRRLIVETGILLYQRGPHSPGIKFSEQKRCAGLIGATRRGSLETDRAFIESMMGEQGIPSPALFGYTLPNIPLAETAVFFGLVGPVYAIFADRQPLQQAVEEARMILTTMPQVHMMFACEFDYFDKDDRESLFSVTLAAVDRDAESNTGLPEME